MKDRKKKLWQCKFNYHTPLARQGTMHSLFNIKITKSCLSLLLLLTCYVFRDSSLLKVFCIAVLLQLLRHLAFCSILQYIGNWTIGSGKNIKLATIFPPRLTSSMYKTSYIFRKMTIFWGALVKLTNVLKHFQMSSVVYWIFLWLQFI